MGVYEIPMTWIEKTFECRWLMNFNNTIGVTRYCEVRIPIMVFAIVACFYLYFMIAHEFGNALEVKNNGD